MNEKIYLECSQCGERLLIARFLANGELVLIAPQPIIKQWMETHIEAESLKESPTVLFQIISAESG